MYNPSNLYAEKIFSEHPTALWALDDNSDYISLINDVDRNISLWDLSECTASISSTVSDQPFIDNARYVIQGIPSETESKTATLISNNLFNFDSLNQDYDSFSIGCYFYSESLYLNSISIGYEYTDVNSSTIIQNLKNVPITVNEKWMFLSETFPIIQQSTNIRVVIKIGYSPSLELQDQYQFFINGLSIGQWSEEFNSQSLGLELSNVSSSIALESSYGIEAKSYGSNTNVGYYLSNNNFLTAKNFGVPLVYGAYNTTHLYPNKNIDNSVKPSLIIPGLGFLNEVGKYQDYTFEMWAKITNFSKENKKIFGPISSSDGLYVEDSFLTLVVGNNFKSAYINEWSKPMLIQITYSINQIALIINGENAFTISLDGSLLNLPKEYSETNKNQDWLGFYCYEDVLPIELDCIAIYPYVVPEVVAKKRWVYGQAVSSVESIDSSYNGTSAQMDYTFSNYAVNYSYPNIGSWGQAKIDNLVGDRSSLHTPEYILPEIFLDNGTTDQLYSECKNIQNEDTLFFTLKPDTDFNGILKYSSYNVLIDKISCIYGVFEVNEFSNTTETLLLIKNKINSDYFSITLNGSSVYYKIMLNGLETILHEEEYSYEKFQIGINIDRLILSFGKNVAAFFGNTSSLEIMLLNDDSLNSCYSGKVYSFGFSTKLGFEKIAIHFNDNGIAKLGSELINHISSYTFLPKINYDRYYLDIGVEGYWEDYVPLKYFAKYTTNYSNEKKYDLDYLQFNLDYPSPSKFQSSTEVENWTYGDLNDFFSVPIARTYEYLDNSVYTGYKSYDDLSYNRSSLQYEYDTRESIVKAYISFQFIKDGLNKDINSFTNIAPALKNGLINIDNYEDWQNTLFEVVNDSIIYPPSNVDFNDLAIVVALKFTHPGIIEKELKLKSLELSSQSFDENSPSVIGTRSGTKLYPYVKNGLYYNYKSKNPISVYKKSTPYLFLSRYSGISLRGSIDPFVDRGIGIIINENKTSNYLINNVQLAVRYDEDFFNPTPTPIFEIVLENYNINFYMIANSPNADRAKIYAVNSKTGKLENGISYYLNGILVSNPIITKKYWNFISLSFANPLKFNSFSGSINLKNGLTFNNISYYKISSLKQRQSFSTRVWDNVKQQYVIGSPTPVSFDWQYWDSSYLWYGVLVRNSSYDYGTTPSDIYKTYMGTNKIIVGNDGEKSFTVGSNEVNVYTGSSWQQYVVSAT